MIKDGDELDNIGGVKGAKSDDTAAPTALKDQYYHGVREVAKYGNSNGAEDDRCHPDVGEQGDDGAHV